MLGAIPFLVWLILLFVLSLFLLGKFVLREDLSIGSALAYGGILGACTLFPLLIAFLFPRYLDDALSVIVLSPLLAISVTFCVVLVRRMISKRGQ